MKFLSKEWAEAVKEKSGEDAEYLKKAEGLTFKFQWGVTSCPGGVDRLLSWETHHGKVASVTVEERPAPSDIGKMPFDSEQYFMRATAGYDTWVKLIRREITAIRARMSGVFKLDGNMLKIIAKLGQIQAFVDMAGSVAAEY